MTTLHHAGLCPADIDESIRFYRDGIGLEILADFTLEGDFDALLGRHTQRLRSIFLGSSDSPQRALVELLDMGEPGFDDEPARPGVPHRGLFLLSFHVKVDDVLGRLAGLGLGGTPRPMTGADGAIAAATVVDPDGVMVELLNGPVSQLPSISA